MSDTMHKPPSHSQLDFSSLRRAVLLVAAELLPVAGILACIWAAAFTLHWRDPVRVQDERQQMTEHRIVLAQMKRINEMSAPDLLFVGDSGCLMGINVPALRQALPGTRIESVCTLGFVGPGGYASMIRKLITRGAVPKKLIVAIHPVQFNRLPEWDVWADFVRTERFGPVEPDLTPVAALDYVRLLWLASLVYEPMPGAYGLYYGSTAAFVDDLLKSHGSAVDPATGLNFRSPEELAARAKSDAPATGGWGFQYRLNDSFLSALDELAAVVAQLGPERVYFLLLPAPHSTADAQPATERAQASMRISNALKLPPGHVINSVDNLPPRYFSTPTHLSRWGSVLFTRSLVHSLPDL